MYVAGRRRPTPSMRAVLLCAVFAAISFGVAGNLAAFAQTGTVRSDPERREFTLFFGSASAQLDPLSKQIVEDAAAAAKRRQVEGSFSHVKVIGYADTAGPAEASQRISEQRATAVREELVRLGLPGEAVRVEGRGKKELAVQTRDRVSEPRNRRARVVIYGPGE
jgi:outer membrane protein OmpA-like peptidoglycan-associated protein